MRRTLFVFAIMSALTIAFANHASAEVLGEVRPFVGAYIPTGDLRDVLPNALFVGGQGAIEVNETVHLVGTLAWMPNRTSRDVSAYAYDAGVEGFRPYPLGERWEIRPFIGAGLGARTYVDHGNGDHKETNFAGYGALGTELQLDRLAMRVEARDYVTRFKGLAGELEGETRNDLALVSSFVFHW